MRSHIARHWLLRVLAAAALMLLAAAPASADAKLYQKALRSTGWVVVPGA